MNASRYLPFVGRLFIGLPFMVSGLSKLAGYAATIALIESSTLPLPPPLAYAGAVTVEIGCGLLIILGYQTRIVALVFALRLCSFIQILPIPTRYSISLKTSS